MKSAALESSFDSPFRPELLSGLGLHRPSGASASVSAPPVEPEPVLWRSEAFAEDLPDLAPAETTVAVRAPLLRRALAAMLRR